MKLLKNTLAIITLFSFHFYSLAQTTPTPPVTPSTSSSTSSYKYSSNSNENSSSHSISIKNDNSIYRFRASFDKKLNSKVRSLLMSELTNKDYTKVGTSSHWKIKKQEEDVFTCKLHKNSLKIYLDKDAFSLKFQKKIEQMGEKLKFLISGRDPLEMKKRELERAKKQLERAQKAYDRAKRGGE